MSTVISARITEEIAAQISEDGRTLKDLIQAALTTNPQETEPKIQKITFTITYK